MSLMSMKNITRKYLYIIPMRDKSIDWVNILGKYQQEILVFTDCKGQPILDDDVKLTGVDGEGGENEALLKIESENYLNYQEYQYEFRPK